MLQCWDIRILRFQNAEELLSHPVPWFILPSKKTMTIVHFTDTGQVHQNNLLNIFQASRCTYDL